MCIFLDASEKDAAQRAGGYGEEKYETREMQRRVRGEFGRLLEGERNVVRMDAGRGREVVEGEMLEAFMRAARRLEEEPSELGSVS